MVKTKSLRINPYLLSIFLLVALIYSCREPNISADPSLMVEFHNARIGDEHGLIDTLLFDTILVDFGSVTKYFKVVNPHNEAINISTIQLMGGDNSQFRINVDGVAGNTATDVLIEPKDSIYVFAEVTIDPGDIDLPFIVEDSVQFNVNGNEQYIKLLAYGQNAHFHEGADTLAATTTTWIDDKPHVILGYVYIDTDKELNIQQGVNVHLHNGSSIVAQGNLNVYGTKDSIVTFSGTRLEYEYQDLTGQWGAIFLGRNTNPHLENFEIRNAIVGLSIGSDFIIETEDFSFENATNCTIKCGIIRNSLGPNLVSYLSNVKAENCLFYDSNQSIALVWGGEHQFDHCTVYSNAGRDPSVLVSNFFSYQATNNDSITNISTAVINATFNNSIIHGALEQELAYVTLDTLDQVKEDLNINFNYCLLKDTMMNAIPVYNNCIFNEDPMFANPNVQQGKDFRLLEISPCINKGTASEVTLDLSGLMRNDGMPDIGCYEFE